MFIIIVCVCAAENEVPLSQEKSREGLGEVSACVMMMMLN